ncbi:RING finger protein 145 [Cryptotermes secundus]|uniref:RING finger protein 145 n=2 Tax=Cryptotermes secundus TaxID=105785 RepID=A0A2J7RFM1_9NEOP|nr:RING finger protein 145 isoform X2 [Cryptotermes secundus]XP_033606184.1 RING finger protein 145 isoform X2 [Cryptotermes secundus]PNF39630.1 RING finger protein 145 [Cryptotermes secundus]PNF39631.1 RING finger protein 145 [Cryptotermes secundus]
MLGLLRLNIHDEQIEKTISVILRLPGLFLLDYWCHSSSTEIWTKVLDSTDPISAAVSAFILIQSLLLLLLPLEDLVTLYMHYLSAALIAGSQLISHHYVQADDPSMDFFSFSIFGDVRTTSVQISPHFITIATQIIMATVISFLLDLDRNIKKVILAVYTVPVAARLAHFPIHYLETLHNFSSALTLISVAYYTLTSLPRFLLYIHKRYKSAAHVVVHQGPVNAAFGAWEWSFLMPQFLLFWCVLISAQLYQYNLWHRKNPPPGRLVVSPIERGEWHIIVLYALAEVCASPISLIGCCIAVSYASWMTLNVTKVFIQGTRVLLIDRNLDRAGVPEGVTMALLALQTGLIDLPMPQRMATMCMILFIIAGSLMQSMHEIVEPVLLSLSASPSRSILRHVRVLAVCLFLLVCPLYVTVSLCELFGVDFWILVVISTCTLTSVQVLGALIVYGLFMYDVLQKDSGWEALDDIVYITRAIIHVTEFLVAVLVVGSGIRDSVLLSAEGHTWSWLNGSILAVHCYYNVFLRLQSGWQSFLLRREAARKILALPSANLDQLESHSNDVCAICYIQMKTACVTPCGHLFHASCLKKWLYVQDRCPLCSSRIASEENKEKKVPDIH